MSDTTLRDQLAKLIVNRDEFDGAEAILAAGWRPPARVVTTVKELDALPRQTIIRSADGWAWQRDNHNGFWYTIASEDDSTPGDFAYPLTVLYEPEEGE